MKNEKNYESRKNLIKKITIIIIFLLIIIITSFKSGEKFYTIKNTNLNSTEAKSASNIAKWHFEAEIIY